MNAKGFTIIEILLFLSITTGMFVIAGTMLNGQQSKTQFTQSVQNFKSRLSDLANDAATGYFKTTTNFTCSTDSLSTTPITFTLGAAAQGANTGCIVIGQEIQFTVGSSSYQVQTLAGKEKTTNSSGVAKNVVNVVEAAPVPVPNASVDAITENLAYGTVVGSVSYDDGSGTVPAPTATGLILASTFGAYGGAGGNNLNSGDIQADLIPLTSPTLPDWTLSTALATINGLKNPKNGFRVCLQEAATNPKYHADVIIGSNGRQLNTIINMGTGVCI